MPPTPAQENGCISRRSVGYFFSFPEYQREQKPVNQKKQGAGPGQEEKRRVQTAAGQPAQLPLPAQGGGAAFGSVFSAALPLP